MSLFLFSEDYVQLFSNTADGVFPCFYLVTTGWIMTSAYYVRIQSINQINYRFLFVCCLKKNVVFIEEYIVRFLYGKYDLLVTHLDLLNIQLSERFVTMGCILTRAYARIQSINQSKWSMCLCCHPIFSGCQACGRTSRGHTGGRSHRISPPFFCGACLNFYREKDSAVPFPRRP